MLIVIGANNVAVLGAVVVVDGESYLPSRAQSLVDGELKSSFPRNDYGTRYFMTKYCSILLSIIQRIIGLILLKVHRLSHRKD